MPSDDPDLIASQDAPSVQPAAERRRSAIGELFAFLRAALFALRDLWVVDPPEPPVPPGEAGDAP